jgi:hypothetical protein
MGMRWRRLALGVIPLLAALAVAAGSSGSNGATAATRVQITFTGAGGGRYLDVTRWLRDDTRDCYARRTADETVSVSWRLRWTASLARTSRGFVLRGLAPLRPAVKGSIKGMTVRDGCDVADPDVDEGWIGSDRCVGALPMRSRGGASVDASVLALRGPIYGSPPKPCELTVRNDQLAAHVAVPPRMVTALASGKTVSLPVGTAHPGPGDNYLARRFCSAFPHIYDGVVYLYDCDDTLAWKGTVTLRPS